MTKSPAFQFYVQDFLIGVRHFNTQETGAYILLLCEQWDTGYIENSPTFLKKITGISEKKLKNVLAKFEKVENKLFNKRLELEREKQNEYRDRQRLNGGKGGRPKKGLGFSGLSESKPTQNPDETSSSSTSSSIIPNGIRTTDQTDSKKTFIKPDLSDVVQYFTELKSSTWNAIKIQEEAQRWIDHYSSNGWKVGKNQMKDWKAAVRNWLKNSFDTRSGQQTLPLSTNTNSFLKPL